MENTREKTRKAYENYPTETLEALFRGYQEVIEPRRQLTKGLVSAMGLVPLSIEAISTFVSRYYNDPQLYEKSDPFFIGSVALFGLSALASQAYRKIGSRGIEEKRYWTIKKILEKRKNID